MKAVTKKMRPFPIGSIALILLGIGVYSYKTGYFEAETVSPVVATKEISTEADWQKEISQLKRRYVALEKHYHIQVETNKQLSQQLKQLQNQNSSLVHDIALYQSLAGALPGKGVHLNTFQIFPSAQKGTYHYFFILAKNASEHHVEGQVKLSLMGVKDKQKTTLTLSNQHFKFRQLHEFKGEIELPENFAPAEMVLDIQLAKDKTVSQQKVPWSVDTSVAEADSI